MTSHLDTLGLGGLLAVLSMGESGERAWSARLVRAGLWLGLPVSAGAVFAWRLGVVPVAVIFSELGSGLLFVWLVARAAHGFGGVAGSVLNASPLRYVGKVSYGIYVYHFNVPGLLREKFLPRLGLSLPASQWVAFPILVATTIVIAAASWEILERPINRLKRHFEYRTAPAVNPT
jgi:peptidoglycan/LPS O-acetylase OafA/YrhL